MVLCSAHLELKRGMLLMFYDVREKIMSVLGVHLPGLHRKNGICCMLSENIEAAQQLFVSIAQEQ